MGRRLTCKVCGRTFDGVHNATTCPDCLGNGVKWCKYCNQVKALTEYSFLYDRPMACCKACNTMKRLSERRTDAAKLEASRRAAREYQARVYATAEGKQHLYDIKQRHRSRIKGTVTAEQWQECLAYFECSCAYCGSPERITVEHIIPVSKFGANRIYNVIPACHSCNSSKRDRDILEWYPKQPFYTESRLLKIHSWFKDMQEEVM